MDELIEHLKEEKFAELKARLKKCQTSTEQNEILGRLSSKELDQFTAWLLSDGNTTAALHMAAMGLALKREFPARG
jgi:hypothetical protein